MSSINTTCTNTKYNASEFRPHGTTGNCTVVGIGGCVNPTDPNATECVCNPIGYVAMEDGSCQCAAGYGSELGDASDCDPCMSNTFQEKEGKSACKKCPEESEGYIFGPNTYCTCTNGVKAMHNGSCVICNRAGQQINTENDTCTCKEGYVQNTRGECISTLNKAASLLSVVFICTLVALIVACIAAAIVVRRRAAKAYNIDPLLKQAL